MHKNATKCNKTQSKWCINRHGASKIIDTFETYQAARWRMHGSGAAIVVWRNQSVVLQGGWSGIRGEVDGIQMWKRKISRCNSDDKYLPAMTPRRHLTCKYRYHL
jgi:hypothetical protein